jgi:hypothetical protein
MHLIFSVNARLSPIYKLPTFPHFLFISFVHKDDMCNNLTSQLLPLVMLGASDGSQGHKPQSCSVRPLVVDKKIPLDVSCQVLIQKACPWNIVDNMFEECHAPYTLKTSFVDFERVGVFQPLQKTKCFIPTHHPMYFQWQSEFVDPVVVYGDSSVSICVGATGSDVTRSDVCHVPCPEVCSAHPQPEDAQYTP